MAKRFGSTIGSGAVATKGDGCSRRTRTRRNGPTTMVALLELMVAMCGRCQMENGQMADATTTTTTATYYWGDEGAESGCTK